MTFNYKNLNNIGGSTGRLKLFFYNTSDTLAVLQSPDYFKPALIYGLNSGDIIIIISTGSNGLYIGSVYFVAELWILFPLYRI